jgi:hypothetical protein
VQVSLYETRPPTSFNTPNRPMFFRDRSGRTLFYSLGPRFCGYVVRDAQCEWALRNAVERLNGMQSSLSSFAGPLIVVSILLLDGPYSSFALAVLNITLTVAVIIATLQRRWCFGDLVAGLARVEPLDVPGRRLGLAFFALIAAAYCSFVVWRIVQAYQPISL